jgi:hypothetical protein
MRPTGNDEEHRSGLQDVQEFPGTLGDGTVFVVLAEQPAG